MSRLLYVRDVQQTHAIPSNKKYDKNYINSILEDFVRRRRRNSRSKNVKFRSLTINGTEHVVSKTKQRPHSLPCIDTTTEIRQRSDDGLPQMASKQNTRFRSSDQLILTKCPGCGVCLEFEACMNSCVGRFRNPCESSFCVPCSIKSNCCHCHRVKAHELPSESFGNNNEFTNKPHDEVKYTISFGFTVKRKFKTKKQTTLGARSVSTGNIKRHSEQSRKCNPRLPKAFGDHSERNDIKPRLRHTNETRGILKPRPVSDSLFYQDKGIFKQFEFDDDFHPIDRKEKDIEMKTGLSKKPVRIHLLNNDSVVLVFETKSTVRQLFEQVCTLLSIKEKHFFGLSTVVDNEKWFMDLKYKISKYAPKEWGKEIKRRASDLAVSSAAVLTVQFQVQFYVEHPKLISDPISRHLYYLQLKKNVARSKVLTQDEILFTIASHALQTDLGDHNTVHHKGHYFRPEDYFPSWFIEKWGRDYLLSHLPTLHAEHKGRSSFESQALYIQQASGIDDVPVHYYKLYKNKKETKPSVLLGIFHQGIRIHYGNPEKMQQTPWKLEFEFMWNKVGRLFFTGKRFEIYPEDLPACRKLTYYTGSHSRSKYLLHFLRETHSLYMSLSPYAQQMRKVDGKKSESEAARRYRESYIAGKNLESADTTSNEHHSTDNEDEIKSKQQGREKSYYRSMTSHGSSHTSGIESDSKQRTEEEDDEDNYADDFDPIAHDHAREEIIDITEDHLTAPPSKSLSVNNLADPNLTEMKIKPLHNSVLDVKRTGRPSRGNTLTGDDFCIVSDVSLICENNNPDLKTPKHLSVSSENRDDTLKNGVPLDVLINAVQNNKISDKPNAARSHSSKHVDITDHGGRKHRKKVRSFIDTSTQTATPQKTVDAKLYYDDFHTIPRKPRVRSHTEDPKSSAYYIKAQDPYTSRHQHHQPRVEYHTHHEKKSGKRPSSEQPISKSNSESIPNWKSTAHTIHRTQSSDNAGPASFITGGKVKQRQGKSVNSIPSALYLTESAKIQKRNSAFVPVSRSTRESNPIGMEKGYYTVARGYDKYIYYDDVNSSAPNGNVTTASSYDPKNRHYHKGVVHPHHHPHYHTEKPRRTNNTRFSDGHTYSLADQGRLSSFEDDDFSQKMSEACMRTLSAQRRKLSDSRFTHRMDSGRGSLRTYDSSSGLDVPNLEENHEYFGSPHTPANKQQPLQYDLLRTPFVESYNEVIV